MTRYNAQQVYVACVRAGFSTTKTGGDNPMSGAGWAPAEVMAAIAMGESGGDDAAVNSSSGAAGVFQILPSVWGKLISEKDMHDLNASALFCYNTISHHGTTFQPWVVYLTGRYLDFLPLSPAPAGASPGGDPTGGTKAPSSTDTNPPTGNTILGLTVPTTAELQEAGIVVSVALFALFVMGVSVYALVKD